MCMGVQQSITSFLTTISRVNVNVDNSGWQAFNTTFPPVANFFHLVAGTKPRSALNHAFLLGFCFYCYFWTVTWAAKVL